MLSPLLTTGVIKGDNAPTYWVRPLRFGVFVIVATLTRQCQIIQRSLSTLTLGNDMLNGKWLVREAQLAVAIFTSAPRLTDNDAFLLGGNTFARQRPAPVSPGPPLGRAAKSGAGGPSQPGTQDAAHLAHQAGLSGVSTPHAHQA
jgi:hypothetical protein